MSVVPLTLEEANQFVEANHRHHSGVVGHRFSIGLESGGSLVGCAIVGRPVSRMIDWRAVAEVTRLCVLSDAPKGACSKLYRACWRAWLAMGGQKLITYTLQSESGASLRGAGFKTIGEIKGRQWDTPSRRREFDPVGQEDKTKWELSLGPSPTERLGQGE